MSSGDQIQLSLDIDATGDDTLRNEYNINSPKAKGGSGRSGDTERQQYGINSPRAGDRNKKNQEVKQDGADDDPPAALAALTTQVTKDDNNPRAKPADKTVSVEPKPMNTEANASSAQTQSSCWSSIFCCCAPSLPEPPPQQPSQKPPKQQTTNEEAAGESAVVQELEEADNRLEAADNGDDEMPGVQALDGNTEQEEEEVSDSGEDPKGYLGPRPAGKKRCLVLDLDETLVHSSFKAPGLGDPKPDFIVPVVIDGITHKVYVLKRPFADEFLRETAKHWELVIFTASLSKYADPLLDMLDKERVITARLFREHCVLYNGNYVKDLSKVGRKLKNQVFIDNAPKSYLFQPNNAVPITSWFDDMNDTELKDIIPVLNTTLLEVDDVRSVLDANNKSFRWLCRQATSAPES